MNALLAMTLLAVDEPGPPQKWDGMMIAVLVVLLIIILVVVGILWRFIGLYIRAWISGASVGMFDLIGMSLRKVNPLAIVNARIQAVRAGLDVTTPEMESHVLAGGDVVRVINAMIAASKANIDLSWQIATAIDLAGPGHSRRGADERESEGYRRAQSRARPADDRRRREGDWQ